MKAVILAAGYGKRLRPLTDAVPKPLIEVGGMPVLELQIHYLKYHGINDIMVIVGYKKEQIIDWLTENRERLGVNIMVGLVRDIDKGTAHTLSTVKQFVDDEFFVLNGDILTNLDLTKMKPLSMALVPLRSQYGVVEVKAGKIVSFREKPILNEFYINAGIYCFDKSVFSFVPDTGDLEKTTFPELARLGILNAVIYDDVYWRSIDSIKDVEEASIEVQNKLGRFLPSK